MRRRILSLWLPCFATDRLHRALSLSAGRRGGAGPCGAADVTPLVAVAAERGRMVLVACDRHAQGAGLSPGMPLADARALEPGLRVLDADPAGDAAALARLADWACRYTPWTAIDPAEQVQSGAAGLWLDVTGCAHLFGGEAGLLADLEGHLARAGLEGRAGIADTPGAAWAVARFGDPDPADPTAPLIVPPGGQGVALAPLPVAALRLPAATVAGLRRVGLHRVGDLLHRPRPALASRFGVLLPRRLDQALGRGEEPINPHRPVPAHTARLAFAEPISTPDDLHRATRHLLDGVCRSLTVAGQGARRLVLAAWRVDGRMDAPPQTVEIGTFRPARDPAHLFALFARKLESFAPGPGFEVMALSIPAADPFTGEQAVLGPALAAPSRAGEVGAGAGAAGPGMADPAPELVDRLGARLGLGRILQPRPRESWWPERAVLLRPADAARAHAEPPPARPWPVERTRPVRLLPRPEPVEVTAPVPDDPPILFRWRGTPWRVRRADGPERLAPEWWRALHLPEPDGDPRDYYRVEATDGRRFWLYRHGLYRGDAPVPWYLHGFLG
jgi:protein ImuB